MTDPFEALADPTEAQAPRPSFARALRSRLLDALDLDPAQVRAPIDLPRRKPMPPTTTTPTATAAPHIFPIPIPLLTTTNPPQTNTNQSETSCVSQSMTAMINVIHKIPK